MSETKNLGFGGPDGPRRGDGGTFKFTPFAPASQKEDSNQITREFYDSLLVEYRFLDSAVPTTETEIFGERFSTPIMIGGMSAVVPHLHPGGMREFALAAAAVNTPCLTGYLKWDVFAELCKIARMVRIIKPQRDNAAVLADIKADEEAGAFAFAMDIDHVFSPDGNYFPGNPDYGELGPKTTEELRMFCESTSLPCIVKGVLSVSDAVKAADAGAAAVLLSHHKGELPGAVPPAMVLPEIKAAVGDRLKIFVDCGIVSGLDAFKALALGADAVAVARNLVQPYRTEGAPGIEARLRQLNGELRGAMARTGTRDTAHFDPTVLRRKTW